MKPKAPLRSRIRAKKPDFKAGETRNLEDRRIYRWQSWYCYCISIGMLFRSIDRRPRGGGIAGERRSGFALLATVAILALLSMIALGFLSLASVQVRQASMRNHDAEALTVLSDTFVVRAYGDSVDESGQITARAWCEAIVQRSPVPVDSDESGLDSRHEGTNKDFGRQFDIKSFRWLNPEEV